MANAAKKASEVQNGDVKSNLVILKSVYGKTGQVYFIQPQKDKFGNLPECVKKVDSHGDMILTDAERNSGRHFIKETEVFRIDPSDPSTTTFDLSDPVRAAEWEAIRNCVLIAPSRDARDARGNYLIDGTPDSKMATMGKPNEEPPKYGLAELYVEIPGVLEEESVSRRKMVIKAQNLILGDERGRDGQLMIAKVLGRNLKDSPTAAIEKYLLDYAESNPKEIINVYTGGDLHLSLLFIEALERRIIRKEHGAYVFGSDEDLTTLGTTKNTVIEWMKQPRNQGVLKLIRQETYPELYSADEEKQAL